MRPTYRAYLHALSRQPKIPFCQPAPPNISPSACKARHRHRGKAQRSMSSSERFPADVMRRTNISAECKRLQYLELRWKRRTDGLQRRSWASVLASVLTGAMIWIDGGPPSGGIACCRSRRHDEGHCQTRCGHGLRQDTTAIRVGSSANRVVGFVISNVGTVLADLLGNIGGKVLSSGQ